MRVRPATLPFLLAVLIWLALAGALAAVTSRVSDWFVMTDELLYERLALSIARLGSPFPHVHDVAVSNINQLYPLLLALVFRHGLVPHGFHQATSLNAFVMTSAVVPAYLLARGVTGRRYALARGRGRDGKRRLADARVVPAHRGRRLPRVRVGAACDAPLDRPSRNAQRPACDRGLCLAVLARTQFYLLAAVLPVAVLAQAAVQRQLSGVLRAHRALAACYALGVLAALALARERSQPARDVQVDDERQSVPGRDAACVPRSPCGDRARDRACYLSSSGARGSSPTSVAARRPSAWRSPGSAR